MTPCKVIWAQKHVWLWPYTRPSIVRYNRETVLNFQPKHNGFYNLASSVCKWPSTFQHIFLKTRIHSLVLRIRWRYAFNVRKIYTGKIVVVFLCHRVWYKVDHWYIMWGRCHEMGQRKLFLLFLLSQVPWVISMESSGKVSIINWQNMISYERFFKFS